MANLGSVFLLLLSAGACIEAGGPGVLNSEGAVELDPALPACVGEPLPLQVDTVAVGLDVPWDVVFTGSEQALITERSGSIRAVGPEGLRVEPWAVIEVDDRNEVGLMGIDLANVGGRQHVYVNYTYRSDPTNPFVRWAGKVGKRVARAMDSERGHTTTLRVARIPFHSASDVPEPEVIISGIPSSLIHGGGALRVGPDSTIYVATGDAAAPASAGDSGSFRGKILRYELDGSIPQDSPVSGSPIFASGIRHSQGIAWDPETDAMLAIDHGPTGMTAEGGRRGRDELNVIVAGGNLGWPSVTGVTRGGPWTSAIASWTPAIAPAGLAVYAGGFEPWQGSAFVTGLRGASLRRIEFDRSSGTPGPTCEEVVLDGAWGRLRLVRQAPDGSIWVGTSNRDGRGTPREQDDVILRIRPEDTSIPRGD